MYRFKLHFLTGHLCFVIFLIDIYIYIDEGSIKYLYLIFVSHFSAYSSSGNGKKKKISKMVDLFTMFG